MQEISIDRTERIESGALRVNDDWPGLFLRGDDCIRLAIAIRAVLDGKDDPLDLSKSELEWVEDKIWEDVVTIKSIRKMQEK